MITSLKVYNINVEQQDYKITKTSRGYLQKIWTDPETGKLHREYVHRIVWEESYGSIPEGYVIHHIDGNKENNEISNLELKASGSHIKEHGEKSQWTWRKRKIDF